MYVCQKATDKKGIWNYIIHETLNITLQNKFNQN